MFMFILVMSMTVILVFVMTRRESYNPWLPWNWFRKPERPRSTPERPYPIPERPRSTPERPYPMPERPRPRPMPERPYPMPERPRPRPMDPRLALIPEHNMRPSIPYELIFSNRPGSQGADGTEIKYR
jgi:hypothetical protein